ncbi:MBL fold metallo-hydrolase [Nocardia brasiliensis]|uniref:MBL fold metallo-hydrolase n=1 Tax=Nocardia brasiliensis TaxID=37326 RepID=UPI00245517F7|nr:MBL fold metallo-hydrolase [Nocardia brasiliensis]
MTLGLNRHADAAPIRSHQLGEHRITYLPDGVALLEPRAWFPSSEDNLWIEHSHLLNPDGYLVASVGALLVEFGQHAMLIDAGLGPLALPSAFGTLRGGMLLKSLEAVGKTPRDIDLIALTHLHLDHLGWLWQRAPSRSKTPFAHAEILISTTEWTHRELAATDGIAAEMLEIFAPQVRPINDGEEIFPGVEALATPGHTLGHTACQITSRRRRLIAFGDAMTCPIQITHPHLTTAADDDPDRSITTAHHLIDELSHEDTLGIGIHFGDVQLGRVTRTTEIDRWEAESTW